MSDNILDRLDNMLNFKQFSSMIDFSADPGDPSLVFQSAAQGLGALCGVLVWEMEDESGFAERARFGYGEDGFFYSFLARGQGNLEKLQASSEPLVFRSEDVNLYSPNSILAVSAGIRKAGRFVGFLILEYAQDQRGSAEIGSFLLANFLSGGRGDAQPESEVGSLPPSGRRKEVLGIECFLAEIPGFRSRWEIVQKERMVLVLGNPGSGKKSLAKYAFQSIKRNGKMILVNTLPENFGKLEKSLAHWSELAGSDGVLVFDKVFPIGLGQQRIFFEWLEDSGFRGQIFFLDTGSKVPETYPPFWGPLTENSIYLPDLDTLSPEVLGRVVDALFGEVCSQLNRENMRLDGTVRQALVESQFPGNLEELRSRLGNAVWRARGNSVIAADWEFQAADGSGGNLELPDSEDLDLPKAIEALERQKILLAHKIFSGNQMRMAKALKISRGSLQYKMRNLKL